MVSVRILAATVLAAGLIGPERAQAALLSYEFELQTQRVYDRLSGVDHPASPLLSETGTASLTVDIHADDYTIGDPLPLTSVRELQIEIFGGTFGPDDLSMLVGAPPFAGPAFLATIEGDPDDGPLLTQFYFGVAETTAAGSLAFDPAHLTEIPAPGVSAFVAQFDGGQPSTERGPVAAGTMEVSVAKWGVVPAPPALPLALAGLGGLVLMGRRGRRAAGRKRAAP